MRNKILLGVVIILSIWALKVAWPKTPKELPKTENKVESPLMVKLLDSETNEIKEISLEDYIVGVVAAEMPASFNIEALKAQAVAARTYALYKMEHANQDYDLVTDVTNQSYLSVSQMQSNWQEGFSKYYAKVQEAVNLTKDEVMKYNDEVICAFYFALSNGYTEEALPVFGQNQDYITNVSSTWDENVKNFEVTTTITPTEFCTKLKITCADISITNIVKSPTGRVNEITINGQTFKGTEIRKLLNLRSTDFQITLGSPITITTKGYGHGVGMSQYGANALAQAGKSYTEILNYYYQNITITKINV